MFDRLVEDEALFIEHSLQVNGTPYSLLFAPVQHSLIMCMSQRAPLIKFRAKDC